MNQRIPPRFALLLALSLGGLAACEIITSTDESKLLAPASEADGGASGDASTPDGDGYSGDTSTDSGGGGEDADSGADAG